MQELAGKQAEILTPIASRSAVLSQIPDMRLVATYENAGIGIVEVDAQGTLLRVNAQLCSLMGYCAEEILGRSIFDESFAGDVEPDLAQFQRQVAGEIDRYTIEKRIKQKSGGYFWASITSSSICDEEGQFLYAVRVHHDITDRRRAQEALARRVEEQAALYTFTERLQHAHSLEEIYEPALEAICRGLRCQRAAVLLFDPSGVMRFVSWRGLSANYRRAVEGHSPWSPQTRAPQPIRFDHIEYADLPDELRQTLRTEGICALAFIPLLEGDRLIGKFMTYCDVPHVFTDAEMDLAVAIARQLAHGIGRIRAERGTQMLASIVESSYDAIVSKDLDGIITTWNDGAERMFGYKAEEVVGKSITILMPEDRLADEPKILKCIASGKRVDHFETVRRCKDGRLIDVSLTISPMRGANGKIVGASKIVRDITERKKVDKKLRDSERQLQDLLSAIPAAIYTTDANGRITYFNQAAVDLAGRTPTLGSDEWCVTWKLFWPDGTPLPHDQCPMAIALKEGRSIRNMEAIAERPDGIRIPFIPYPTPLRDEAGKIVGAINMLVDVSERKQAETQQQALLSELNHRVKNNMQMLQSLLYTSTRKAKCAEAKQILAEASGRIAAMVAAQQVLYGAANTTHFKADDFLATVCQTAKQTFPTNVEILYEATAPKLSNDVAIPLSLILNELLTNAVKHGINGHEAGTIRVGLTGGSDSFLLYVEDDGPGFDWESVRERSSGLRLVQGLARQLRGRFEVARTPATRCILQFS